MHAHRHDAVEYKVVQQGCAADTNLNCTAQHNAVQYSNAVQDSRIAKVCQSNAMGDAKFSV